MSRDDVPRQATESVSNGIRSRKSPANHSSHRQRLIRTGGVRRRDGLDLSISSRHGLGRYQTPPDND
jgi:hypothetical protein